MQTTVDIYGHLTQGANRNEANGLDDAAFGDAEPLQKAGYQGLTRRGSLRHGHSCVGRGAATAPVSNSRDRLQPQELKA
jgi:hypothetical protein